MNTILILKEEKFREVLRAIELRYPSELDSAINSTIKVNSTNQRHTHWSLGKRKIQQEITGFCGSYFQGNFP